MLRITMDGYFPVIELHGEAIMIPEHGATNSQNWDIYPHLLFINATCWSAQVSPHMSGEEEDGLMVCGVQNPLPAMK
jgi:hypothetical protein